LTPDIRTAGVSMNAPQLKVTYIGGPTALLELGELRLLTDPTFDPAGSDYPSPATVLRKTQSPALTAEQVGAVDVVLLSHDHHFDNLDHALRGRGILGQIAVAGSGEDRGVPGRFGRAFLSGGDASP
jgi:hypothetical protein